jgi:transglutaminase-like putative cysteine protease
MRLYVQHRTEYFYTEPQSRLVQLLRVSPGNHLGQSVISWSIEVDRDARLKPARDGYGNEITMLYVDGPVDRIAITVSGEVLTEDQAGMIGQTAEPLGPLYFLQPTPLTAATIRFANSSNRSASGPSRCRARMCWRRPCTRNWC